jgi:hypothetical protein
MHLRLVSLLVCVPVLAGLPGTAGATSIAPLSARDMVGTATRIVHATVIGSTSRWNEDHTLVVTETRLRILASLKGDAGAETTVRVPGGQIGKLRVEVPGAVPFAPGEEWVLFLVRDTRGHQYVSGLDRGRLDVVTEPSTGRKLVRAVPEDLARALATVTGDAGKATAGTAPMPLDSFETGLRALVRDVAAKGGR